MSNTDFRNVFLNGDLALHFCVKIECQGPDDNFTPSEEISFFLANQDSLETLTSAFLRL